MLSLYYGPNEKTLSIYRYGRIFRFDRKEIMRQVRETRTPIDEVIECACWKCIDAEHYWNKRFKAGLLALGIAAFIALNYWLWYGVK